LGKDSVTTKVEKVAFAVASALNLTLISVHDEPAVGVETTIDTFGLEVIGV